MIRKYLLALLCLSVITSGYSQESREARRCRRGQAAGYATRDATVLSMMGWGLGLAVSFAAIAALIDNNEASGGSTNGSGTNGHS